MSLVAEKIRNEIAERGPISFARFMELALYCPLCGFYEKKTDTVGRRGDFYTSVSVGPLFGEMLAFQFSEWLEKLQIADCRLQIVEAGAHDGTLARDILSWLRPRRPEISNRIEYCILEPSASRREWQEETLADLASQVRWFESPLAQTNLRINGVIFSNELLDALPVHRVGWDAKRREWFEWGVTLNSSQFTWTRLDESAMCHLPSAITTLPSDLLEVLPDGFTTEISPAAETWWRKAANSLVRGKLLTLDYGLNAEEFFAPQRAKGTLRAYRGHRVAEHVLSDPGEQDITTHVNFTSIQQAGETAGLKTELMTSQAQFLTDIAKRAWAEESGFGPWTNEHTRRFQTLTHPDHLGRAFRVLVQTR